MAGIQRADVECYCLAANRKCALSGAGPVDPKLRNDRVGHGDAAASRAALIDHANLPRQMFTGQAQPARLKLPDLANRGVENLDA